MGKIMHLTYSSSLSNLCEINSSFDTGVLRVAYTDANRNGSFISKDAYERCIKTIYNCPVVCNYNRDDDSIGGHDSEIVSTEDGGLRLVNITQPVGVIPESANYYWENITEENGSVHEYLCVDVLLWKRQEAYRKIKEDGITSESMEVTVKDGRFDKNSGYYVIEDFEFTAFCLLGDDVEPCFEQAALEVFSANEFKQQMTDMMAELKETFTLVNTQKNEIDIKEDFVKGGNEILDEKLSIIEEFGMTVDALDFSIEEMTEDELREKLTEMKCTVEDAEPEDVQEEQPSEEVPEEVVEETADDVPEAEQHTNDFALNGQIVEGIYAALENGETIESDWGKEPRYWLYDFDIERSEVYVHDCADWNLYGFPYSMNGDNVVIDWAKKKRMKCAIVEYDEGDTAPEMNGAFSHFEENYQKEIKELKEFKLGIEEKEAEIARNNVFAKFEDLEGNESFEALKENAAQFDADTLEEKCFAIRGRLGAPAKFSLENKPAKIIVEHDNKEKEPYGGLFQKYGFAAKD